MNKSITQDNQNDKVLTEKIQSFFESYNQKRLILSLRRRKNHAAGGSKSTFLLDFYIINPMFKNYIN